MKTMEQMPKMGNQNTTATISPSNCDLTQVTTPTRLNHDAAPGCDSNGTVQLKTNKRKSNLYQSKPKSKSKSNWPLNKNGQNMGMAGTSNIGHGESDCDTSASPRSQSKKPLHLQIIEDGTCSSSGNENSNETPYSAGNCILTTRPSPSENTFLKRKNKDGLKNSSAGVPVTSERCDIIHRESSMNDGIIIHSSSSPLSLASLNASDSKSSSFKAYVHVPLEDEFKKERGSFSMFGSVGPKDKINQLGVDHGNNANSNSINVKNLSLEMNSSLNGSIHGNKSESSTPDLASALDGSISKGMSMIINPSALTSTVTDSTIRDKSMSGSEINSELDGRKASRSLQSTLNTATQPKQSTQSNISPQPAGNVASTLDQVLAELEENGKKHKKGKPCILQQSLIGDSESSTGTSTPNEDVLDAKKDGYITSNAEDKANSLHVQSSMLLPEDSLNVIAQMTVSPGTKKEKKNVVTFKDDNVMNVNESLKESQNDSESPNTVSGKINSDAKPKRPPLSEVIKMDIVHPIVPSPSHDKLMPQQDNQRTKTEKRSPLISGTASAHLKLIAGKSSNEESENTPAKSLLIAADKDGSNEEKTNHGENGIVWEKGMSMLADIISNATPMKMKSRSQPQSGTDSTIAPVGQSLRLYTSIAAQAGISSYTPTNMAMATESAVSQQISNIQQAEKEVHDCETNIVALQESVSEPQHFTRQIGKIRRYDASIGAFGEWEDLPLQTYGDSEPRRWCELNIDESIEIPLRRGGRLRVFPNFLGEKRRSSVKNAMDNCPLYRQYNVMDGGQSMLEPRLQVLLSAQGNIGRSNNGVGTGYVYKGVSMKASPLSEEPQIEKLHNDLAELYRLPNKQWNIGANLLYYRDGDDHITWHSDDTQGEALILCLVVDSPTHTRAILVRPKTNIGFRDGDEEIIIWVGQGDAYEMDGQMQMNYEHCLPVNKDDLNAKRTAIVFRHGSVVPVSFDTGIPLINNEVVEEINPTYTGDVEDNINPSHFGHVGGEIREGKKLYTKKTLKASGAHRHDKKIICGSIREGCESILVESQNRSLREDDGLCWLQISCNKVNGGGALCQSYHKQNCIRVFRSSDLQKYAPTLYEGEDEALYRYDGLYKVRAMWDPEGCETEEPPSPNEMYTFFLMRQPKRPADGNIEDRMNFNKISLQELWNEIQKRKGVRKPKDFAVPEPIMDVGRIGGGKRRIASSRRVLKNEEKNTKQVVKRRNVNVIPLQIYSTISGNGNPFHHRAIYSSDSDSFYDSEDDDESIKAVDAEAPDKSFNENGRPRRKSAAVARSYLKEVMHNRYGDTEANTPQKPNIIQNKKRSIWSADGKSDEQGIGSRKVNSKRHCKDELQQSSSDASIVESIHEGEKLHFSDNQEQTSGLKASANELQIGEGEEEVADDSDHDNKNSSSILKNDEELLGQSSKNNLDELDNNNELEESEEDVDIKLSSSEESDTKAKPMKPATITVGSRVNVEYRNTLFKATVRRNRVKAGTHEYLIHYDGNKKSNVHWIKLSMIHEVLDDQPIDVSPEVKPKRGRKKKTTRVKPVQELVEEENFKFAIGSEVYVTYKNVLYLSIVLNAKKNKKGNAEYLVHYEGFKKTADRWIKESAVYEMNEENTIRFNEQRGLDAEKKTSATDVKKETKNPVNDEGNKDDANILVSTRSSIGNATKHFDTNQNNQATELLDMGNLDSGVEFLPGSCVFVVKTNALYLAKMVKRRKKGKGKEYLVQFDGMSSKFNEWISLSNIYELNPKTRKIYERTATLRTLPEEEEDEEDEDDESKDEVKRPKQEKLKTVAKTVIVPSISETSIAPKASARISKRGGNKGRPKKPQTSKLYDMDNIEPGVEFLPGSTLFVQWKNGLYLGKMLKKRGKGENMEYLIHYDGYKSSQDEWVSVSMVFEINPQTKRAFNKQKKTKT